MQIFVETLIGKIIAIDVEPHHTIKFVKRKIQEKDNIPPSRQRLFLASKHLKNRHTLAHYNIWKDSTLNLILRQAAKQRPDSRERLINTTAGPITAEATHQQQQPTDIPMQIFVQTLTGKTISLDVKSHDAINFVKAQIQDVEGIHPAHQRLFLGNKHLKNDRSLSDYNILKDYT